MAKVANYVLTCVRHSQEAVEGLQQERRTLIGQLEALHQHMESVRQAQVRAVFAVALPTRARRTYQVDGVGRRVNNVLPRPEVGRYWRM